MISQFLAQTLSFERDDLQRLESFLSCNTEISESETFWFDFFSALPEGTSFECFYIACRVFGGQYLISRLEEVFPRLRESSKYVCCQLAASDEVSGIEMWNRLFDFETREPIVQHLIVASLAKSTLIEKRSLAVRLVSKVTLFSDVDRQSSFNTFLNNLLNSYGHLR